MPQMPRHLNRLALFAFASVLLTVSIFFSSRFSKKYRPYHQNSIKPDVSSLKQPPSLSTSVSDYSTAQFTSSISQTLHVAIVETGGSHDEVVAALVHSFGSQPSVQLSLYQLWSRYGISDMMQEFDLSHDLPKAKSPDEIWNGGRPDIFVSATCELDLINKSTKEFVTSLLNDGKTYIFCVVHHADRWRSNPELEEAIAPWLEKGRIEFITLSPHTLEYFSRQGVNKWGVVQEKKLEPIARCLVPVFPVSIIDERAPKEGEFPIANDDYLSFAIQGDFAQERRDYKALFERLSQFLSNSGTLSTKNLTLHLLGHGGRPEVPATVKDHVEFDEQLPYIEYYTILSKAFALIPAFASAEYLDRKASSSVPASLIAGAPLVATQEMIAAYGYLNENTVWLQKVNQTDMDVVASVLNMTAEDRRKKNQAVVNLRKEIIKGNIKRVGDWVEEALQIAGR